MIFKISRRINTMTPSISSDSITGTSKQKCSLHTLNLQTPALLPAGRACEHVGADLPRDGDDEVVAGVGEISYPLWGNFPVSNLKSIIERWRP